jgi:hypothetical protein
MIRMKSLLREMTDVDIQRCLEKIRNKQYEFIAGGDNGKVYQINGEDKVFKITGNRDEYEIAEILVDRYSEFTTFIPVYYVDGNNMFIVANAEQLPSGLRKEIDMFMQDFALFSRDEGGEVSVFDFADETDTVNPQIDNFLTALRSDVNKLNVMEFDLDLDFRADNIMIYNGKMVMVDW